MTGMLKCMIMLLLFLGFLPYPIRIGNVIAALIRKKN